MSKTVRVYDSVTERVNTIPAAELAPGMVEAQVEGVGRVWINSAQVEFEREYQHPPFESGLRDIIEREIQKPLAEVFPRTLEQWEDGFRRDTNPEKEIGVWCRIAARFVEFSESEVLNAFHRFSSSNSLCCHPAIGGFENTSFISKFQSKQSSLRLFEHYLQVCIFEGATTVGKAVP